MTDEENFSFHDGVICKTCRRIFSFNQSQNMIHGLTFPNRDFSSIQAKCPRCYASSHYTQDDIKRASKGESELVTQLRGELAQEKIEKETLRKLLDDFIKQKITDIAQPKASSIENENQEETKNTNGEGIYR